MIGTNDIQTSVAVNTYLTNIDNMITTCLAENKRVIIAIPPMFYSYATASNRGNATTRFNYGSLYRSGLMRLCAAKGVKLLDTLGGLGNILATYLDTSFSNDPMVYDNIHPSMFGRLLLAQLFSNAILGDLAADTDKIEHAKLLPTSGLSAGSLFTTAPPRYSFDSVTGQIFLSGQIDLLAALANNTKIYTLPPQLCPARNQQFLVSTGILGNSILNLTSEGEIHVSNSPATATYVSLQISYCKY